MALELPKSEYELIRYLAEADEARLLPEASRAIGLDQSIIAAAARELESRELVTLSEEPFEELTLRDAGQEWLRSNSDLPEFRIRAILDEHGPLGLPEVAKHMGSDPGEVGKALRFLFSKGLAKKVKETGNLAPGKGDVPDLKTFEDVGILERFRDSGGEFIEIGPEEAGRLSRILAELKSREFVKIRSRVRRRVGLTDKGRAAVKDGLAAKREKNQLEPGMLIDGSWRETTFRPYDVTLDSAPAYPAKPHPLRQILEETRRAFQFLGFEEIRGPYVESAFWDFDALFQPQDHPAREMQDTFYINRPARFSLPEKEIVDKIRATHENGGDTGSIGWGYKWKENEAQRVVLRTHTTAATVIALKDDPAPPRKVFLVGRVFRREKTDYKHLPEFHQVDGIIVDEHASLSALLGTLTAFYRQMGFDSVKFRPSFFPYTEPSVEVFVRMPGRETDWFELGGSGVFRPEVARPFGCTVPVLAWGLGLERLAMARYGITDIRKLYLSDFSWLEETPLCR